MALTLNKPSKGVTDWHEPLNENFQKIMDYSDEVDKKLAGTAAADLVTVESDGLMSKEDKEKLDNIDIEANKISLNDSVDSYSIKEAATANAVRKVHVLASSGGKRCATLVIGNAQSGHSADEVDFLCSGTTNDQVIINNAIVALPSIGGKIIIREGVYNLNGRISVNKDNIIIEGMGNSTVFKRVSSISQIFFITSSFNTVKNLYINGEKTSSSDPITGIYLSVSNSNSITEITCTNCGKGIFLNDANNNTITKNTCSNGNSYGIQISKGLNNLVSSNICNNNLWGIYCGENVNSRPSANVITSNIVNDNRDAITLNRGENNIITNNVCMRGTGLESDYSESYHTIYLYGANNHNNLVAFNSIMGKDYTIDGGSGNVFEFNKFE